MRKLQWLVKKLGLIHRKRAKKIHERGLAQGFRRGALSKNIEFTVTKNILTYDARERRTHIAPHYGMGLTERHCERIRGMFPQKYPPTPDQEKFILSNRRNMRVMAGAGSGKSTTLIQRLLVLHRDLGIPLSEITVFSFTTASCKDFRAKMIKAFGQHDIRVTQKEAEKVVRTFHSKIFEFARQTIKSDGVPFEFLNDENKPEDEFDLDSLGSLQTRLSDAQMKLLKEHYQSLYESSEKFQSVICDLMIAIARTQRISEDNKQKAKDFFRNTHKRDEKYSQHVHECFDINCETPDSPIEFELSDPKYSHLTFLANRYEPLLDLYIVFTPNQDRILECNLDQNLFGNIKLHLASNNKRTTMHLYGGTNVICVSTQQDVNYVNTILGYHANKGQRQNKAPLFDISLEGEFGSSSLMDAFYSTASFIESVGLEVDDFDDASLHARGLNSVDALFLQAVVLFWPGFTEFLNAEGIVRFHEFFAAFSDENSSNFGLLKENSLKSMSHLMIDEFQDISSEAVNWIRATLYVLRECHIDTSLVSVGDDFQSIYGWRGASPTYLMEFEKHFPSENLEEIRMNENFRSHQSIVDVGEHALVSVKNKSDKHGVCEHDIPDSCHITLLDSKPENDGSTVYIDPVIVEKIIEFINVYNDLDQSEKGDETFLLVLARGNKVLNHIQKEVQIRLGSKYSSQCVQFQTFHRSKGLEARHCVLVQDCSYDSVYPLRNIIYEVSGEFQESYDQAQREEAKRLAYVAMTRAMESFWWFGESKDGGVIENIDDFLKSKAPQRNSVSLTFAKNA